jgi:hypothetical protein
MKTVYTKAANVGQVYDDAQCKNISSGGCYALAVATAHKLGGIEIANSNNYSSSWSFAPTRTFEFDDSSAAQITYGGVFVIAYKPY